MNYGGIRRGLRRSDVRSETDVAVASGQLRPLPTILETGHAVIDAEHRHLLACVLRLRAIRDEYLAGRQAGENPAILVAQCETRLTDFLSDLLAYIVDHFRHEERIMRDSLHHILEPEVCAAHMENHAEIAERVQSLVVALHPASVLSYLAELEDVLFAWLIDHITHDDMALVRWLERDESLLRLLAVDPA